MSLEAARPVKIITSKNNPATKRVPSALTPPGLSQKDAFVGGSHRRQIKSSGSERDRGRVGTHLRGPRRPRRHHTIRSRSQCGRDQSLMATEVFALLSIRLPIGAADFYSLESLIDLLRVQQKLLNWMCFLVAFVGYSVAVGQFALELVDEFVGEAQSLDV